MKFQNHAKKIKHPFIVYADCECSLVPCNEKGKTHKHVANSCAYYFVCNDDPSRNEYYEFFGSKCIIDMIWSLKRLAKKCTDEMQKNEPMIYGEEDKKKFCNATTCHICNKEFKDGEKRVRDHDHKTGKFRGAAHSDCNVN